MPAIALKIKQRYPITLLLYLLRIIFFEGEYVLGHGLSMVYEARLASK